VPFKSPFESPPADAVANQMVLDNPRFSLAVRVVRILNYSAVTGAVVAFLIAMMKTWSNDRLVIEIPVVLFLILLMVTIPIVVWNFRGLVWYNFRLTVPNPSVLVAMFATAAGLMILSMMMSFSSYLPMFKIAAIISVMLWIVMLLTTSEFKAFNKLDIGNMIAILILLLPFSYGAYTTSNVVLDGQEAQVHPVTVTDKRYDESRDTDYYEVSFTPAPGIDRDHAEITAYFYRNIEINDTIYVKAYPGRWGSEWYELALE
jgi:hypothetical protein